MQSTLRPLLRDAGASLLYRLGLTHPARAAGGSLTIVTFHRVLPPEQKAEYPHPGIAVTPETFAACLDYFGERYDCRTVTDALAAGPSTKPVLAVTFDDGQLDNFEHARPLLARKGIPATFYIPTAAIDRGEPLWHDRIGFLVNRLARSGPPPESLRLWTGEVWPAAPADFLTQTAKRILPAERERLVAALREATGDPDLPAWAGMMIWDQVRTLAADGHEIGSHTITHPILLKQFASNLAAEVAESKARLESTLGRPVRTFAYPNGDWDADALAAVRAAGYESAVTTRPGLNPPRADPFTLARHDLDEARFRTRRGVSKPVLAWRLTRSEKAPA